MKREVEEVVGLDCSNAILASAKQGIGIHELLEAIVERIAPPANRVDCPLRALIFDSYYDSYKGARRGLSSQYCLICAQDAMLLIIVALALNDHHRHCTVCRGDRVL